MQAQNGNKVKLEFVGKLDDGTVFGEATAEKPLEFTLGSGEIIAGLEEAVIGLEPGQSKDLKVPAEKAFGNYEKEKIIAAKRDQLPQNEKLEPGMRIQVTTTSGQRLPARVEEISDSTVKLNFNHPLAGKNLDFHIQVLEVA